MNATTTQPLHTSSTATIQSNAQHGNTETQVAAAPTRYYALDSVRATAMLLGVFYHLPIALVAGGFAMGFGAGFGASPKTSIDHWLHSFRMPLFFLISGFFANMMLGKYGLKRYMLRRWWRIGAPLLIALVLLAGVRILTSYYQPSPMGPSPMGASFGARARFNPWGQASGGFGAMPQPHGGTGEERPGAGSPFSGFPGFRSPGPASTTDPPASRDAENAVGTPWPSTVPGFGPPPGTQAFGPFGGVPGGFAPGGGPGFGGVAPTTDGHGASPFPFPNGRIGSARQSPSGESGPPAFGPFPELPGAPSRDWSERLFGVYSHYLNLEHLWFLWYLLIFVTLGPVFTTVSARLCRPLSLGRFDRLGGKLIRLDLLAFFLALVTLPALVHARGFAGWSLANPKGFSGAFPDFLVQYFSDQPFYLCYFLAGWWLFRLKDGLPDLARYWLWNAVLGIAGFAASQALSDAYAMRTDMPQYQWIRLGSFALYGLGTAYSTLGFLGFFQRFLNRPTTTGRYIADTALWIYLAHLPLIPYLLWWIEPSRSAWWASSLAGMVVVTGVTLVVFELIVRPTPLVYVFGPASPRRPKQET